jgi:glutamate-1-semialdehyde 2,1-aminomutase
VYDEAGAELIDLNNNFTVLVHGNAHPEIHAAAVAAIEDGTCFGLPTSAELDHAEALVGRVPWAEQVRYTSSGTEAVMTAVRIARATTGRSKIAMLRPAYHGTADAVLPAEGPEMERGIPRGVLDDLVLLRHNDLDDVRAAVAPGDVAAVILDLMPALGGCVPLDVDFVMAVETAAAEAGTMLIVDEIISFRLAATGFAFERFHLEPDLLVVGKTIGGGFPVGAVLGRAETMAILDPSQRESIYHGGTFSANPVTMHAGRVALDLLDEAAIARLNDLGDYARKRFADALGGWRASGVGSVLRLDPPHRSDAAKRALFWAAYRRGLLLSGSGTLSLSTPMNRSVVDEAAKRLGAAIAELTA